MFYIKCIVNASVFFTTTSINIRVAKWKHYRLFLGKNIDAVLFYQNF